MWNSDVANVRVRWSVRLYFYQFKFRNIAFFTPLHEETLNIPLELRKISVPYKTWTITCLLVLWSYSSNLNLDKIFCISCWVSPFIIVSVSPLPRDFSMYSRRAIFRFQTLLESPPNFLTARDTSSSRNMWNFHCVQKIRTLKRLKKLLNAISLTRGYGDRFVKLSTPSGPDPSNSNSGWNGATFQINMSTYSYPDRNRWNKQDKLTCTIPSNS